MIKHTYLPSKLSHYLEIGDIGYPIARTLFLKICYVNPTANYILTMPEE